MYEFLYFLPIYSEHQVRWTYQPGSHRRKVTGFLIHLPSAVRALIFLARRIHPFLSLVDRVFSFINDLIDLHSLGICLFFYMSSIELYLVYKQIQTAVLYVLTTDASAHCARILNFLVELTTSRFGHLTRLIHITLLYMCGHRTY